ncbi:MAG: O-methyltransferase [Pseudomonadota bacterium]
MKFRLDNADRLLPTQPVLKELYKGSDDQYFDDLLSRLSSVIGFNNVAERYDLSLPEGINYETLGSSVSNLALFSMMVSMGRYKTILEIGTFVGVSAMFLAEAAGDDGRVITLEIGEEFAEIARKNISSNGFDDRIKLIHGDANQSIEQAHEEAGGFDLVFLDGDKGAYCKLFIRLLDMLNPGGAIVVDDALFHCDVLNGVATTEKGQGVADLLDLVADREDLQRCFLPVENGVLIVRKP